MQGQVRLKALRAAQCGALFAGALLLAQAALAAKAELNAEVPAEKWKALRLKDLPKDASVAIRVITSGPISVIFAHQGERGSFPQAVRPAFTGTAERSLTFRVTIPVAGSYYVILDNRKGSQARTVRIQIEALPARAPEGKPPAPRPDAPRGRGMEAT
jgi:hypothetical protein